MKDSSKESLLSKISSLRINYCILIALCIMIGELGDKTFLASIGLEYNIQITNFRLF